MKLINSFFKVLLVLSVGAVFLISVCDFAGEKWILSSLLFVWMLYSSIIILRFLPLERRIHEILESDGGEGIEDKDFIAEKNNAFLGELNLAVQKYTDVRDSKKGAEIFQKQTELMALQSQINPHFLYNTLDTIRGQALIDKNLQVASMIETLSAFFRYSISGKENMVMLRDEINHTINYISIQKYRFGQRFEFDVVMDEEDEGCMNYYVPRLILQPIVENAIFHGLEDMDADGTITLDVTCVKDELVITVSDNGKGMNLAELDKLNQRIHSEDRAVVLSKDKKMDHTGIALPNINRRIKLLYGEEYGLNVYSSLEHGTDVEIVLPMVITVKEQSDEKDNH